MGDRRAGLPAAERARASAAGCARLSSLPALAAAAAVPGRVVAGFAATRGEIDPREALDQIRRAGGDVALPRVDGAGPRMTFHRAPAGAALVRGRFGIDEPDPASPAVALAQVAAFVVPGMAFDAAGRRLGFGGGYYDELLAARPAPPPLLVGFAYDFQVVDRCPAGPGDVRVDWVVTDARAIRCDGDGGDAAAEVAR
jgi:5-formyltetrahydrofolate cyclo-ligase